MSCKGFAKYSIIFFNFLIVLAGIGIIAIGAIGAKNDFTGSSNTINHFAIAIGVIIFFIAFLGCCGAMKENSCMLTTFAVILVILFILEVVVGILALVAIKQDGQEMQDAITKEIKKMIDEKSPSLKDMQETFECCGANGPSDYHGSIPDSCHNYTKGCANALKDFFKGILKALGGVAIFFAIIELAGASFACYVRNRIGE